MLESDAPDELAGTLEPGMPLEAPGTLESGGLEMLGTLEPGRLEELPIGSDADGKREDENGGRVPVDPPGNELLLGTVTIRLDEKCGLFELEDPTGTDIVTLPPGKVPRLLEDAGLTTELPEATGTDTLPLGELPTPLEDPEYCDELAEAGTMETLSLETLLEGGGMATEPGVESLMILLLTLLVG